MQQATRMSDNQSLDPQGSIVMTIKWWLYFLDDFQKIKQKKMGNLWRCYSKHTSGKILGLMEWNLTVGILSLLLKFLLRRTLQCSLRHPSSLSGRICGCFQDDYALEEGTHSDLPWLRLSLNCSLESAQVLLWYTTRIGGRRACGDVISVLAWVHPMVGSLVSETQPEANSHSQNSRQK